MKILLSGFEPFGGSAINPSAEVIRAVAGHAMAPFDLHTVLLPVTCDGGPAALVQAIEAFKPDAILCLGQAGGRSTLSIERVALNLLDFSMPDNAGKSMTDAPIVADGPAAYFATLPVRALLSAIRNAGVPAELSLSAGTYLCNQVLYAALHHIAVHRLPTRAGFIHLPSLPEQAIERPGPSMALGTMIAGIRAALVSLAQNSR